MTEIRTSAQRTRDKIRSSLVVTRLIDHVEGRIELSTTQVSAARILLNKILPDVKSIELTNSFQAVSAPRLTDEELMSIAAGGLQVIEGECEKPRKISAV